MTLKTSGPFRGLFLRASRKHSYVRRLKCCLKFAQILSLDQEAWLNSTPAPSPPPSPRRQKLKDILLGESYAPSRSSGFYNDETRYNERSFSDQTRMPRSSQSNESGVTIHDAKRRKKSSNTGSNIPSGTPYDNIKFSSSDTPPKDCKKSGPNGKGNCSTMRTSCCARGRRRWVVAVTILAALVTRS